MEPFYRYALGLALVFLAAAFVAYRYRDDRLARAAFAVAINWFFGVGLNVATGITDGWWFNIVIDALAATVILWRPAGRFQSILGVTYCIQIAMHCGYGLNMLLHNAVDPMLYYDILTGIAWAQLAVLGGWVAWIWSDPRRARRNSVADRTRGQGMAEP